MTTLPTAWENLYSRPVVATIYPTAGVRNAPFSAGAKTW